jgi:hypothetical protein
MVNPFKFTWFLTGDNNNAISQVARENFKRMDTISFGRSHHPWLVILVVLDVADKF